MDIKKIGLFSTGIKKVDYPEIGSISYKRNSRARRLSISVKSSTGVKVTIPGTLSFRSAEEFVLTKSKWIVEKLQYFKNNTVKLEQSGQFQTRNHTLHYIPIEGDKIIVKVKSPNINVNFPKNLDVQHEQVQLAARRGIELAYRIEAHEYLHNRVKELADLNNFKYNRIGIKKATSRWGSCSARNNLNFSIFLMKLPDNLIDYIILHELCHTIHKNHGPKFWEELDRKTGGNAKRLSKEVKKYRAGI